MCICTYSYLPVAIIAQRSQIKWGPQIKCGPLCLIMTVTVVAALSAGLVARLMIASPVKVTTFLLNPRAGANVRFAIARSLGLWTGAQSVVAAPYAVTVSLTGAGVAFVWLQRPVPLVSMCSVRSAVRIVWQSSVIRTLLLRSSLLLRSLPPYMGQISLDDPEEAVVLLASLSCGVPCWPASPAAAMSALKSFAKSMLS